MTAPIHVDSVSFFYMLREYVVDAQRRGFDLSLKCTRPLGQTPGSLGRDPDVIFDFVVETHGEVQVTFRYHPDEAEQCVLAASEWFQALSARGRLAALGRP